jgi:hypothetical protein
VVEVILFLRRAVSWLVGATVTLVIALHESSAAVQFVKNAWQESFFSKVFAGITFPRTHGTGLVVVIVLGLAVAVVAAMVGCVAGALYSSRLADFLERLGTRIRGRDLPPSRRPQRSDGTDRAPRARLPRDRSAPDPVRIRNDQLPRA